MLGATIQVRWNTVFYLIVRQVNAKEMLELGVRAPEASIPHDLALPTGHCVKVIKVSTEVRWPLIPVPIALPKAAAAQFQNPPNVISMSGAPAIPQPTLKSPKAPHQ